MEDKLTEEYIEEAQSIEQEENLIKIRKEKLERLKSAGINPYPNDFKITHTAKEVIDKYKGFNPENEITDGLRYKVAGRIMAINDFGGASFIRIQDYTGKIQIFVGKKQVGEIWKTIRKNLDIGDFIGVSGPAFFTKTKELTILAEDLKFLAKSLRPLPEKWHGIKDIEARYRQRYLDLIMNQESKERFIKRSHIIQSLKEYLIGKDFIEVETPMMHPIPGGAAARPFITHHNALDIDLYLRIAPELYLKRLVVGGMERVFEINRNFRNEGISIKHNPEFTMLEFYLAYATYEDLMNMIEEMITSIVKRIAKTLVIEYQGEKIDFTPPWKKTTMRNIICETLGIEPEKIDNKEEALNILKSIDKEKDFKDMPLGKIQNEIFENFVEDKLIQPTFITEYPIEVSPLSRKNDLNPNFVDRFELFIAGREIVNGFSELNDPIDQRERFIKQAEERAKGDEEAHAFDEDFIKALEYGMPPTAGAGLGVDRLTMILTNSASIRDVILFPQMRHK